jgi:hypothetical protein
VLDKLRQEGVDDAALAERLQREAVAAFVKAWCHASSQRANAPA